MSQYYFPPTIYNGSLRRTDDLSEYVHGKILQTLSIIRGELVADAFFGMPLRVFQSVTDIGEDAARVEIILTKEIPEANFRVIGKISEDGTGYLTVYWEYLGNTKAEEFTVN